MKVSKNYHSAFADATESKQLDRFKSNGNIVLFNDIIENGLSDDFDSCDVFYAEPAWKKGFNEFCERAGLLCSFDDYIDSLREICFTQNKPTFLLCGTMTAKKIGGYKIAGETKVHGYKTHIFSWNTNILYYKTNNTFEFINNLMKDFDFVGDFCCGYGNTARIALENNKRFVMSDYNKSCVYFVAKEYMGYEG